MKNKRVRRRRRFLIIILVALCIGGMLSEISETFEKNPAGRIVLTMFTPFIKTAGMIRGGAEAVSFSFFRSARLEKENLELKQALAEQMTSQSELLKRITILQKASVSSLADIENSLDENITMVPASILVFSPDTWARTVIVDRGENHGVRKHQTVISEKGAVGSVSRTSADASLIHLLTDNRTALTVRIRESGELGVVHGTGELNRILMKTEGLKRGLRRNDHIVTAGLRRSLFPQNLPVGVVKNVERDKYGRSSAEIKPAADFSRLEVVFILRGSEKLSGKGNIEELN